MKPYTTIKIKNREGREVEMNVDYHPIFEIPNAKQMLKEYSEKHHPLNEDGLDLAFDFDYAVVREHMDKTGKVVNSVTDIGCAWGAQNLFFQDKKYIGIDMNPASGENIETREYIDIPFFREGEPRVEYYITKFPHNIESKMVGDVFISNMSVGYTSLTDEDKKKMYEAFNMFNSGYIRAREEIMEVVFSIFPNFELVRPECYESYLGMRKMYYVSK